MLTLILAIRGQWLAQTHRYALCLLASMTVLVNDQGRRFMNIKHRSLAPQLIYT